MTRVITYGTFDLLHFGHVNLLKRAKALGDYLIVGVTSDDFDKRRGKINVKQSLTERIEALRETGLADEIIVEEYEGQKIDDIKRLCVDIFAIGSDWVGKFDYLKEFCKVEYLPRTEGVSSTEKREVLQSVRFGLVGETAFMHKYANESEYVNGLHVVGLYAENTDNFNLATKNLLTTKTYDEFLDDLDAVYIASLPKYHYEHIKHALMHGKHVLCESPIAQTKKECEELFELAKEKHCILMESIKTAYSISYYRLLLLSKIGEIGNIVAIDSTCTSLMDPKINNLDNEWSSIQAWGPTALLPVFQLLGGDYLSKKIVVAYLDKEKNFDAFTNIHMVYKNAVANIKVARGVKSEGELVISGTKACIHVPSPWWKTDYFEIRYENPTNNKRVFYQLDGEGIRYELLSFVRSIASGNNLSYIDKNTSLAIAQMLECFETKKDVTQIELKHQ